MTVLSSASWVLLPIQFSENDVRAMSCVASGAATTSLTVSHSELTANRARGGAGGAGGIGAHG